MTTGEQDRIAALLRDIAGELDALGVTADESVSTILDSCDRINSLADGNDAITAEITAIYEACASHDLTKQRLQKILRLTARIADPDLPEDDILLEGPQSSDSGLSQDAADRLMNDGD